MNGNVVLMDGDVGLVARAAAEPEAFAAIYDEHVRPVYNYVRYRVADPAEAEDVVSSVFQNALAGVRGYDASRGSLRQWLFGIARNAVRDHHRRTRRWRLVPLDALRGRAARTPAPDERLMKSDAHARLCAALETLADKERDVLGLRFGAGLGNREAAELLGLTPNRVAVLVYRALGKLRAQLGKGESCR